jgi:hypothetical protein
LTQTPSQQIPTASQVDVQAPNLQQGASTPNPLASSPFADTSLSDVLTGTSEMTVGTTCDAQGSEGESFTFKSDGTGGCAEWRSATAGQAADGTWLLLIPTVNAAGTNIFSLLYAQSSDGRHFIGIMPGDGHGAVDVSIENGEIVERYHGVVRISGYSNGRVSTISTN